MRSVIKIKNSRGDTLIEVLLAISIVGLILVASYALANRSTQAIRQAQERSEALKNAESQVESLITFLNSGQATPTGAFCLNGTTPVAGGCSFGPDGRYGLSISTEPSNPNTYNITVRWDRVTGGGQDELTLRHRIYRAANIPPTDYAYRFACSNGVDDDEDGKTDYPTDPGCANADDDNEVDPPTNPTITVYVEKVPPKPGGNTTNNTPDCTSAGSISSGVPIRLATPINTYTGTSTATFNNLNFSTTHTATLNPTPSRFAYCGSSSQSVTTGAPYTSPTSYTMTFKIRPLCYISYYNNYWTIEERRPEYDGWWRFGNSTPYEIYSYFSGTTPPPYYYWRADGDQYWSGGGYTYRKYFVWRAVWHSDPVWACPS